MLTKNGFPFIDNSSSIKLLSDLDAVHHVPAVQTARPPGLTGGPTGGGAGAPLGPLHLGLRLVGDAGALQAHLVVPHRHLLISAPITAS